MITVTIFKKNDLIVGAQVEGHAEYAGKGRDIVCSAVSMLYINLVNSLENFTHDDKELNGNRKINFENVILRKLPSDEALLLFKSFQLGVTTVEQKYGKRYIEVLEQDVG